MMWSLILITFSYVYGLKLQVIICESKLNGDLALAPKSSMRRFSVTQASVKNHLLNLVLKIHKE